MTPQKQATSSHKRSLTKAISWESISTVLTFVISCPFTDSICSSVNLAGACLLVKIVFYYQHERVWHQITWGKK
jgi:uncharacterized membrane protein